MLTLSEALAAYDAPGPYLRGGMVLSADGAAASGGSSRPLSPPADRLAFRALRTVADAVLVGAGTARAEGYRDVPMPPERVAWRREHGRSDRPRLAVVTRSGDLPAGLDAVTGTLDEVLGRLREEGLSRVLCEGGPTLLGDLVAAGLLTELCVTVSPLLAGAGPTLLARPLPAPVPLRLLHVLEAEGCLLLRYAVGPAL